MKQILTLTFMMLLLVPVAWLWQWIGWEEITLQFQDNTGMLVVSTVAMLNLSHIQVTGWTFSAGQALWLGFLLSIKENPGKGDNHVKQWTQGASISHAV
jgi:hypothetical protein